MHTLSPRTQRYLVWLSVIIGLYLLYVGVNLYAQRDGISQYIDYKEAMQKYEETLRNDTYGGKTPQATLDLFIQSLEAKNVSLATLYFMPDDSGSRERWRKVMADTYAAGKFSALAKTLRESQINRSAIIGEKFYGFMHLNEQGDADLLVDLVFNGFIWKIDSI